MINENISEIIETISYNNKFNGKTFLIKLGGSVLDDESLIKSLCCDLKLLQEAGIKIVLVHGGSKAINQQLEANNIKSEFKDGLRVTSVAAMQVIEMVLCGHVNNVLVRKLNQIGVKAIGLSGADDTMLLCDYYSQEHGCVGKVSAVKIEVISNCLSQLDAMPVIAPVGVDMHGRAININADFVASHVAAALQVDKLIYITDQDGICDQSGGLLSELGRVDLSEMVKNEVVTGGMLTKVKSILSAFNQNLNYIHVLNGKKQHVLIKELFTFQGVGTLCTNTVI